MIDHPISELGNNKFFIVNSQNRKKEKGHTICVIDIPLNVTSGEIKVFFDKEDIINRFFIATREA